MRVLPVLVAYRCGDWMKVALRSFWHHFPSWKVLVVDNDADPRRPYMHSGGAWVLEQPGVIPIANTNRVIRGPMILWPMRLRRFSYVRSRVYAGRQHGAGIDVAVRFARENGYDALLHFEPDCVVSGTRWYEALVARMADGAWYVGSHRKTHGPIHPCPGLFRVASPVCSASFCMQYIGRDAKHPRFHEVVDRKMLLDSVGTDRRFWRLCWDTAQKPWFEAAVQDRAVLVEPTGDFVHYWFGSQGNDPTSHPAAREYLLRSDQARDR